MIKTVQSAASSEPYSVRRSFKLWYNYTLKASLRRYSSLAISSATQPGISGMATWMTYFRRIAKCCKPPRPQRDRLNTWLHKGTITFSVLLCSFFNKDKTAHIIHIPKTLERFLHSLMNLFPKDFFLSKSQQQQRTAGHAYLYFCNILE